MFPAMPMLISSSVGLALSRSNPSNGVSGLTSTERFLPLTFRVIISDWRFGNSGDDPVAQAAATEKVARSWCSSNPALAWPHNHDRPTLSAGVYLTNGFLE